jgi:hypothetical protein
VSEWWTYRPADFLMFAPRTYWRLFELHNAAIWPAQLLAMGAGLAVCAGAWRRWRHALRAGAAALAVGCAFVAWAFLWQRYAAINWAASGFAVGFGVIAASLAMAAARTDWGVTTSRLRRSVGAALAGSALIAYPLLAPAAGRPWAQAEVAGLAPDPTTVATLGLLLWAAPRHAATRGLLRVAWTGTLAWCAISAATLWTMGSPQAWVPAAAAVLAMASAAVRRPGDGPTRMLGP